jgi:hypothetical protein
MSVLTAMPWKNKQIVNMLTNVHRPLAEGNFCDEYGKVKPASIVQDYNRHILYVDKNDYLTKVTLLADSFGNV